MIKRIGKLFILSLAALMVAACSSAAASGDISQVTPIPDNEPTAVPTESNTTTTDTDDSITTEDEDIVAESTTVYTVQEPSNLTIPTATPRNIDMEAGESRAIAMATDIPMQPTPRGERLTFDESPVQLRFGDLYDGFDIREGLLLSDKLVSLDGQQVIMEGYMAPPLKPALDWFVLTRIRLSVCPFCSTDADWPNDIALIYMPEGEEVISTEYPVRVIGQLEVGSSVDAETGMVSVVRIYVEAYEVLD